MGIAYSPGRSEKTVIRAGFGMYYNDLAQNGWATAFEAVNNRTPEFRPAPPDRSSIPTTKRLTPSTLPAECSTRFNERIGRLAPTTPMSRATTAIALYPGYRSTRQPSYSSDNRSSYNALMLHCAGQHAPLQPGRELHSLQGSDVGLRARRTLRLCDGVCTAQSGPNAGKLDAFGPGDYGPSGEDVRHRFVLAGIVHMSRRFRIEHASLR
jgi:hypothetical protein